MRLGPTLAGILRFEHRRFADGPTRLIISDFITENWYLPPAGEKAELEDLPEKKDAAAPAVEALTPGSPHPPAPDGAKFVATKQVNTPRDAKMRVATYFCHRDQRDEEVPISELLVFKAPNNDARGFFVRCRYYEAESPDLVARFLIDFEVAAAGMIFHRIEGTMPQAHLLATSK